MSLLTNNAAMTALQTLRGINKGLNQVQDQISTGKEVGNAKDNAAIWAVAKTMESDVGGFKAIRDSLALGDSTVAVARTAAERTTDLLKDIKAKVISAQEENVDRNAIQADIDNLVDQVKATVGAAQFNGLNLVKGTEDIEILSSLDRSGTGVEAGNITVARQDLTSSAGTEGADAETAGGYASITKVESQAAGGLLSTTTAAAATTVSSTLNAKEGNDVTLTFAALADTEFAEVTVNNQTIRYTSDGATTANDAAAHFASTINALGIEGVEIDLSAATVKISNTNAFDAVSVETDSTADDDLVITNYNGGTDFGTNTGGNSISVEQRAETIEFSKTASVAEGDTFKVTVDGSSFSYIAGKNENMEDVARGLKTAIDGTADDTVSTKVSQNTDGQWVLAVDDSDADGTETLSLTVTSGGEASGGLFGLEDLDVTTDDGASRAIDNIETMISNSISAASSLGSAQGRIEQQDDFMANLIDNFKSGIGSLVDADMEEASAKLQALQVQQQLGVQALSIANQAPQSILSLFR